MTIFGEQRIAIVLDGYTTSIQKVTFPWLLFQSEIVRHYGYKCEEHDVVTEDGYILTVHRIPPMRNKRRHEPVYLYLQHGLLDSSFAWVANAPNRSLAYMLADEGFVL